LKRSKKNWEFILVSLMNLTIIIELIKGKLKVLATY